MNIYETKVLKEQKPTVDLIRINFCFSDLRWFKKAFKAS